MLQTPKVRLDPTESLALQCQSSVLHGVMLSVDSIRLTGNWGCLDSTHNDLSVLAAVLRAQSMCSVNVHQTK